MKILVIAPHPDDETLGCGGSLFRHVHERDDIYWLIVTGISVEHGWSVNTVSKRAKETANVAKKYKFAEVFNFQLPTTRIDALPTSDLIDKLTEVYKKVKPEIIYMPFAKDVHTDHQLTAQAVQSTIKWFRYPHIKKVMMYETPSETEFNFIEDRTFHANVFVDISKYLESKIETMKIYESEVAEFPFPRSEKTIRSLAAFRGSQCGFEAAEAFELVYERLC